MGGANARADAKRYREGYPGVQDVPSENDNIKFYTGVMKSFPDGDLIDNIHTNWKGRYNKLEAHHGYIQWLFPIREHGMNASSQKLHPHEIVALKNDQEFPARLIRSYELMLDFYGMRLKNRETGEIARNPDNWEDRYDNLNTSGHNYLRITRIMKCLGEFGFEHYKRPWCEFFLNEIFVNNQLRSCKNSLVNYWIPVLRNPADQQLVVTMLAKYNIPDPFAEPEPTPTQKGAPRRVSESSEENSENRKESPKKPESQKTETKVNQDEGNEEEEK